jgi:hypothetical protein
MFGILRPCARHSCPSVHEAWRAHLCGLCLTLRDRHGHLSRMATNYDGLILPVLTEAQSRAGTGPNRRAAGPSARGDLPHLRALSPAVERLPAGAVDRTLLLRPVRLPRLLLRKFLLRRVLPEGLLLLRRVLLRLRLRFPEHRSPGYRIPLQKTDEGCVDISCYHSSGSPIIEDGAR